MELDTDKAEHWYFLGRSLYGIDFDNEALLAFKRAKGRADLVDDQKLLARIYRNLSRFFYQNGDMAKVLEYHQKAINLTENLGDKEGTAENYALLGAKYSYLGHTHKSIKCVQTA